MESSKDDDQASTAAVAENTQTAKDNESFTDTKSAVEKEESKKEVSGAQQAPLVTSLPSSTKVTPTVGVKQPAPVQKLIPASSTNGPSVSVQQNVNAGAKAYTFATGRGNYPNHIINSLKARGNWSQVAEEVALETASLYWRQLNLNYQNYDILDARLENDPNKAIFINHFENNRGICTKTGLIRSLQQYYTTNELAMRASYTVFDTTPTTFVISRVSDDDEINKLMTRYKEIARGGSNKERVPVKHCAQNMWLVKPASLNQGKGIELFRNLRDINEFIFHKNPQTKSWVVQKYVEHPFLFNGRKFDVRVWAVVTDDYRIFFYKHGYLRTSSAEYNLKAKDTYVHLTNQCLQIKGEGYAQHEEGNTLSYDDLQRYFDEHYPQHKLNVEELLLPRIKDIIIDTFLSVKKKMNANNRENCFELFGFDFLLDEDFRTWLIEVNYNPFLGTPNEYMRTLVPRLIEDMVKIVVDPVLKPKNVPEHDRHNDFDIIYQDASQKHGPAVNVRRPFTMDLVYPIPELTPFIGKKKNPRQATIPVRQLLKKTVESQLQETNFDNPSEELQSPRKELTSSATAIRSKSLGPSKQMFSSRRRTRTNTNYSSQERTSTSTNSVGGVSRLKQGQRKKKNSDGGIIEQVEEEDKMSGDYDSTDDVDAMHLNKIKVKRNLLCKNLLDQTKELCYQHSPVYKDFDQIFARIMTRFVDWEIFDDSEVAMACQSLKVVANSGQIVNLVQIKNMKRVIQVYDAEDLPVKFKQEISELFLIIAKNIGLRKIFLNEKLHWLLVRNSLAFLDQVTAIKVNPHWLQVLQNAIKLLCMVCTARKTQFYIPGETNLSERLRKRAFDSGTFTLLTYLFNQLKDVEKQPFKAVKEHLKEQVLNYATLTDLTYHSRLIQYLKENPSLMEDKPQHSSTMEERKDCESPRNVSNSAKDDSNIQISPTPAATTERSHQSNSKIGGANYQVSPRAGTTSGKTKTMKKATSSQHMNYQSQSHASGTIGQMVSGGPNQAAAGKGDPQLNENDTEVLLLSNDKVTITDLWKSNPQPSIPSFFLKLLDLDALLDQAQQKADNLKNRIDKRKNDEKRREESKIEKAQKQKEEQIEQRRLRMEQQEKRKLEQKKFAEELKRKAEQSALLKQQNQNHSSAFPAQHAAHLAQH